MLKRMVLTNRRWMILFATSVALAVTYVFSDTLNKQLDFTGKQREVGEMDMIDTQNAPTTKAKEIHTSTYMTDKRMDLFEERSNIVMQGCEKLNRQYINSSTLKNILIDNFHHIYYCPIPKVGSTFWKRILSVYTSNGKLKSPYEITLKEVKLKSAQALPTGTRNTMVDEWESLLFVRDPYTRLFSGYENKVYQPSLAFWRTIGSEIVKTVRKVPNGQYPKYGFDVTFSEFIKYIIFQHEHDRSINPHFSAMNKMCDPCQTYFKYIGHLETFTDDAEYLLSKWRRKFEDITLKFDDLYKEAAIDTARSHIRLLFETKKVLGLIEAPFTKLMLRTWRSLQIRGYISKYSEFPYEGDVSNITQGEFLNDIASALAQPQNRSAVKLQRTESLIQAYKQVSLEDMEKLRQFVHTDCVLFGYDDRPKHLFEREQSPNDDFLYFAGMK